MEKYIRRKYEMGAFKAGAGAGRSGMAPTSLNRAREKAGKEVSFENRRNPELNDVLVKKEARERELPTLPRAGGGMLVGGGLGGGGDLGSGARPRPARTGSAQRSAGGGEESLIDLRGGASSTLPLQLSVNGANRYGHLGQGPSYSPEFTTSNTMWPTLTGFQQGSMQYMSTNGNPQHHLQHSYSVPGTSSDMNGYNRHQQFQSPPHQLQQQQYQHFQNPPQNQQAFQQHYLVQQQQHQQQQQQQYQSGTSSQPFPQQSYFNGNGNSFLPPQHLNSQPGSYGNPTGMGYAPQQGQPWGMQTGAGMR
ncbi:MAG: hypothetical protein TREMPRED_001365 [Tremellales sp. Tagirdzhanova-0007]|nr:MAG: hypothetical protein TREMPRED_001365 [Tremellales sp. Tagirdzhanova-0007]